MIHSGNKNIICDNLAGVIRDLNVSHDLLWARSGTTRLAHGLTFRQDEIHIHHTTQIVEGVQPFPFQDFKATGSLCSNQMEV